MCLCHPAVQSTGAALQQWNEVFTLYSMARTSSNSSILNGQSLFTFFIWCFLIESRPTVTHVVHRAHPKPFLYSVLGCINRWLADKKTASEVKRADVSTEQRWALFSTAAFYVIVRNAVLTYWCGKCSHYSIYFIVLILYIILAINQTMPIVYTILYLLFLKIIPIVFRMANLRLSLHTTVLL